MQQISGYPYQFVYCLILSSIVAACATSSELSTSKPEMVSIAETPGTTADRRSDVQSVPGPDRLSLANLESFRIPSDGWGIYGKVYTTFPGEPLRSTEGTGILMFDGQSGDERLLQTRADHGNSIIELEYMLQADTCFSLMLQSRYEIRLCDYSNSKGSVSERAGTIYYGEKTVIPPLMDASRAPGVWQRLSVDFHSPRFDETGKKSASARIDRVRLNGETIQRSIELPAVSPGAVSQDEAEEAPLGLKVDYGTAAIRNIGFYGDQKIHIENLQYAYYEENLDNDQQLAGTIPVREESASGITPVHANRGNNFALRYRGTLVVPKSGIYKFESIARGEVTLQVDGHSLIQPTPQPENPLQISLTDRIDGTADLEAGRHPFTLQYKKRQPGASSLSVFVTGPGIRRQAITSAVGAWSPAVQASSMHISPDRRAAVIRSHMNHQQGMVLNGVSVGDPEGVHYSLDVGNAALLQIWQDAFLDAGPIWTGRGMDPDTRMVAAPGVPESKISFSGRPVIAFLQDIKEAWPDSVDSSYRFMGYDKDESGRPTFRYRFDDIEFYEEFRPGKVERANSLIRKITLESRGKEADAWMLLADGFRIERRDDGVFSVDDNYFLEVSPGFDLHHRQSGGRDELLLYVPASFQQSSFTTTFIW